MYIRYICILNVLVWKLKSCLFVELVTILYTKQVETQSTCSRGFILIASCFQAASIYCKSKAENQLEKFGFNPLHDGVIYLQDFCKG